MGMRRHLRNGRRSLSVSAKGSQRLLRLVPLGAFGDSISPFESNLSTLIGEDVVATVRNFWEARVSGPRNNVGT